MSKTTKPPSEADIIFNRVNVALAKQQRLVASWLPPPSPAELANQKTAEELEKEEQELFKPVPELLGVGAKVPEDDGKGWSSARSTDLLRRKLLGNAARAPSAAHQLGKPQSKGIQRHETVTKEDSDTEEGRASQFSLNRTRKRAAKPKSALADAAAVVSPAEEKISEAKAVQVDSEMPPAGPVPVVNRAKRKATSFLDDMLAEKASKRKKKKGKGNAVEEAS